MGSQTTTSKTELPEPTSEELEALAMQTEVINAMLIESGYTVQKSKVEVFANPAKVESLQATVADFQLQLDDLNAQIVSEQSLVARGLKTPERLDQLRNQRATIENNLNKKNEELSVEMDDVTTEWDIKLEDPRVTELRNQGLTEEADAMEASLMQRKGEMLTQQEEIDQMVIDVTKKYLNGDLSITEAQRQELADSTARVKEPVMRMLDDLQAEIGNTYASTSAALDGLFSQIQKTGLTVDEALGEAAARATSAGTTMIQALDETVEASRALAEQGLFAQTRDLRNNISSLAAMTGRSGMDPAFIRELQDKTLESAQNVELALAVQSSNGRLAIMQNVENALQNIDMARVDNKANTGLRLEDVYKTRANLNEATGIRKEGVSQLRASLTETLLREEEGKRAALAQGLPVSQIQTGLAVGSNARADTSQSIANLNASASQVGSNLAGLRDIRAEEKTITQTSTPSWGAAITGALGTALSGAGGLMTGLGDLRG